MNINTNVSLRDRSKVTLSGFKGLDTLSTSVNVSAIHATDMQNLISRDGVNHKRYGWKTKFRIKDSLNGRTIYPKIQGVFDFTIDGVNFLLVYANKKFWLIDKKNNSFQDITTLKIDNKGNCTSLTTKNNVDVNILEDTECKFFVNGNKVYFVGIGDFLVFAKYGDYFELRRVVGNEDVYIPTTTENIGSEEYGTNFKRITAEERNILTPYFYNTLFGPKSLQKDEVATYYLDTKDFENVEITLDLLKENGEDCKVEFKYSDAVAIYEVGDNIYKISFTLDKILKSITNFSCAQGFVDSYYFRWLSYEDFVKAKDDFGKDEWELYTQEEFGEGDYQGYLDSMFKYYTCCPV